MFSEKAARAKPSVGLNLLSGDVPLQRRLPFERGRHRAPLHPPPLLPPFTALPLLLFSLSLLPSPRALSDFPVAPSLFPFTRETFPTRKSSSPVLEESIRDPSCFHLRRKNPPAERGLILRSATTLNVSSKLTELLRAWGTEDPENLYSNQHLILPKLCVLQRSKFRRSYLLSPDRHPRQPGEYLLIKNTGFRTDWVTTGK